MLVKHNIVTNNEGVGKPTVRNTLIDDLLFGILGFKIKTPILILECTKNLRKKKEKSQFRCVSNITSHNAFLISKRCQSPTRRRLRDLAKPNYKMITILNSLSHCLNGDNILSVALMPV